jgi:methionyl-tRNA formyltransferase
VNGLKVVLFTNLSIMYNLATTWAARHEHQIRLVVTTPGPSTRRTTAYRALIAAAPPEQDFLITTRTRRLAAYLTPLAPDLIVSASFPYRIPPEVTALPRLGAYNLHPAGLPRYRGPNVMRPIYEGQPIGGALHRTEADFDTGPILARKVVPLPDDASPENVFRTWGPILAQVWEEGIARGIAGDPGEPQDHSQATYAAAFTEEETWLDWNRPKAVLQRQATVLNMFAPQARAHLGDAVVVVERLDPLPEAMAGGTPGTVVNREENTAVVLVADGAVRLRFSDAEAKGKS